MLAATMAISPALILDSSQFPTSSAHDFNTFGRRSSRGTELARWNFLSHEVRGRV
jgi:hypothetical protein